jgi:hypothetical protein
LLRTAPRGDASLILARQLIAAKLNVADGTDASPAAAAIADADALLGGYPGPLPYRVKTSTDAGRAMVALSGVLDLYNTGRLTEGCGGPLDRPPGPWDHRGPFVPT